MVMSRWIFGSATVAAALTVTSLAGAEEWGLHNGNTLQPRNLLVYGEAGFPDIAAGVQYGVNDRFDIGARLGFQYSPYFSKGIAPGMGVRAPMRISFTKGPKFSAMMRIEPGVRFAQFEGPLFGVDLPVGVEFGIHLIKNGTLQLGLDVPMYLNLTNGVVFNAAPMAGAGFEYQINDKMAVGGTTRFGATILSGGEASGADFGFRTQAYFGYRF